MNHAYRRPTTGPGCPFDPEPDLGGLVPIDDLDEALRPYLHVYHTGHDGLGLVEEAEVERAVWQLELETRAAEKQEPRGCEPPE